jgi:hypothetical protein
VPAASGVPITTLPQAARLFFPQLTCAVTGAPQARRVFACLREQLQAGKTRAFVDFLVSSFEQQQLARRFSAS